MRKYIITSLFLTIWLSGYGQVRFPSPVEVGNTHTIKLYKEKCTDGKCKDGGIGTLAFKSHGDLKEYKGEFGPEGSFKNGKLTFNNGDVYEGTFHVTKGYTRYDISYHIGTYTFKNGTITAGNFFAENNRVSLTVTQSNGAVYQGDIKNAHPNGYATFTYADGSKYMGIWVDGYREGQGKIVDKNNNLLTTGNFKRDYVNGLGIKMINGDTVTGTMRDGKFYGFSKINRPGDKTFKLAYYKDDVCVYDRLTKVGDNYCISGNCLNGKGKIIDTAFMVYEGDLKNGIKDGRGIETGKNIVYTGSFKNGEREGKGKMVYADGSFYDGDWVDGYRNGEGYVEWGKDDYFRGLFQKNSREGKGYRKNSKGYLYDGYYKNDKLEGKGILHSENGSRYEGDFIADEKSGFGTLYYANGDKYEGNWFRNTFSGDGAFTFASGGKYESKYWNGDNFSDGFYTRKGETAQAGSLKNFVFAASAPMVASANSSNNSGNTNSVDNLLSKAFGGGSQKLTTTVSDEKTYVFQSKCRSANSTFTVISKITANIAKHDFEAIKNLALKVISQNSWQIQTELKYLGTDDMVKLSGTVGRDYTLSSHSFFDK